MTTNTFDPFSLPVTSQYETPRTAVPLSFALWAAEAPSTADPDPVPSSLVLRYRIKPNDSKYLNERI